MRIDYRKTARGFRYLVFYDRYGAQCSLQESSLATESCVWFGVEVDTDGREHVRMHLTREMVAELLPALQHFVKTGMVPEEAPDA